MKNFKLIPLALAACVLAACHQGGVGVDAGASQKAATSAESGLRSDRSINVSTSAQTSIQMPAAPLMISALSKLAQFEYLPPPSVAASGPMAGIDISKLIWRGAMQTPSTKTSFSPNLLASGSGLLPIAASAYPWQGWPFPCFGCAKEAAWARGMAQGVVYTNLLLTQLYPALSAQSLADPSAAKAAVQAAWKRIPPATQAAAWAQAGTEVQGSIQFDFTGSGPAPIHFMIGNNDFQASPTGWKWSQNGVAWFGDGAISGQQRSLSLASAIDKSSSQSSTTGTSTGTSTDQSDGGAAGVK